MNLPVPKSGVTVRAAAHINRQLPSVPECDLLCLIGPIVPPTLRDDRDAAGRWMSETLAEWLEACHARHIVAVPGADDSVWTAGGYVADLSLRWTLLQDNSALVAGLRVYGASVDVAWEGFALGDPTFTAHSVAYGVIPEGLDILLSPVSPLAGRGSAGSDELLDAVRKVKPRLVLYGGTEDAGRRTQLGETLLVNVTPAADAPEAPPAEFILLPRP